MMVQMASKIMVNKIILNFFVKLQHGIVMGSGQTCMAQMARMSQFVELPDVFVDI